MIAISVVADQAERRASCMFGILICVIDAANPLSPISPAAAKTYRTLSS
jgi:hypothetical protein